MLRDTAVLVTCLRRKGCQQARLFLISVMVVHVPSAYPAVAQQKKSCDDGWQQAPSAMPHLGEHSTGWAVRLQDLLCPWSLSVDPYL